MVFFEKQVRFFCFTNISNEKSAVRFAGAALFEICLLFRGYRFSASRTERGASADNGADLASGFAPWGLYSVLSASTGSFFAASEDGISPAMKVRNTLIATRIIAATNGSEAAAPV